MAFYCYELYCDDTHRQIVGDHPLDLKQEVRAALQDCSDEQIVEPHEDWFELVLNKVCERTGFKPIDEDGVCDVEVLYWKEHQRREDNTPE